MYFLLNGTSLYLPRHLSLDAIRQKNITTPSNHKPIREEDRIQNLINRNFATGFFNKICRDKTYQKCNWHN